MGKNADSVSRAPVCKFSVAVRVQLRVRAVCGCPRARRRSCALSSRLGIRLAQRPYNMHGGDQHSHISRFCFPLQPMLTSSKVSPKFGPLNVTVTSQSQSTGWQFSQLKIQNAGSSINCPSNHERTAHEDCRTLVFLLDPLNRLQLQVDSWSSRSWHLGYSLVGLAKGKLSEV